MYSSSSKGIVSQALTGAGTEFKRLAEVIVSRHEALDSGVGRCYLAGLLGLGLGLGLRVRVRVSPNPKP